MALVVTSTRFALSQEVVSELLMKPQEVLFSLKIAAIERYFEISILARLDICASLSPELGITLLTTPLTSDCVSRSKNYNTFLNSTKAVP